MLWTRVVSLVVVAACGSALFVAPAAVAVGHQPVFPVQTPAFAVNPDGRAEVFAVDERGRLWHNWENSPGSFWHTDGNGVSTGFHGWDGIGGDGEVRPGVTAIRRADGRLQVYARGSDNRVKEVHQTNFGIWSGWRSLGGELHGVPVAVRAGDDRQVVYFRGPDNAAWMFRSRGPNSDEYDIRRRDGGTFQGDPAVLTAPDGLVNVFVRGTDNRLYRFEETSFDVAEPRWERDIGSERMIAKPAPAVAGSLLKVFLLNERQELVAARQTSGGLNSTWINEVGFGGGLYGDPAAVNRSPGVPQLWSRSGVNGPVLVLDGGRWETPYSNINAWGSPGAIARDGNQLAAVIGPAGRLYFCGRSGTDGGVHTGFMLI